MTPVQQTSEVPHEPPPVIKWQRRNRRRLISQ
jgi:hypothetical protein